MCVRRGKIALVTHLVLDHEVHCLDVLGQIVLVGRGVSAKSAHLKENSPNL
jgi:hypothetical protein